MLARSLCGILLLLATAGAFADPISGSLTVNGTRVSLEHGYALTAPNPFDKSRSDTLLVLSDRPLAEEVLRDRSRLMFAEFNGVTVQIDSEQSINTGMIYSNALQRVGKSFSTVGSHQLQTTAFSPSHITGSLSAPEDDFFDNVYTYSAEFDLEVKQPAKGGAAALSGKPLPKGGGDPGRVFERYRKAMSSGDLAGLRATVSADLREQMNDPDFPEMLDIIRELQPKNVTITGGSVEGDAATLLVEARDGDEKASGKVTMVREGNAWKVQKESWKSGGE